MDQQHLNDWLETDVNVFDLDMSNDYRMICEGNATFTQNSSDDMVASYFDDLTQGIDTDADFELEDNDASLSPPALPAKITTSAKPESVESTLCNESPNRLLMMLVAEVRALAVVVNAMNQGLQESGVRFNREGNVAEEILF